MILLLFWYSFLYRTNDTIAMKYSINVLLPLLFDVDDVTVIVSVLIKVQKGEGTLQTML
jgi:hypothetical protein